MPPANSSSSNKKRKASVAPSNGGGDESGGEDGGEKIGMGTGKGDVNEPGISQSESRRRARVLRNRASAQRSRDAKKNHQQALEDRVRELEVALAQATLGNGGPSSSSSALPIASSSTLLPIGVPTSAPLAPPPNPAWLARRRELERENSELRGRVGKLEELVRGLVGVLGRGMENAASRSSMEAGPSQVAGGVEQQQQQMEQVREEDKGCKMEVDDGGWMLGGEVSPASSSNLDLTYSPSSNNPSTTNHASTLASPSASSYPSNSPYLSLGSSALPPSPPALDFLASNASSSSSDPYSYPSDSSSSTNTLLSPTLDFTSFLNFPTSRPSTPNFLLSSPSNALHLSNNHQSFSSASSSSYHPSTVLTSPSSTTSTNPPSAAGFVDFIGQDFKNFEEWKGAATARGPFDGHGDDNSLNSPTPLDESFFTFGFPPPQPHTSTGSHPHHQAFHRVHDEEEAAIVVDGGGVSGGSGSTSSSTLRSGSRLEVPREGVQGSSSGFDGVDAGDWRTKQWWDGLVDINFDFVPHASIPDASLGLRREGGRDGNRADGCVRNLAGVPEVDWVLVAEVMGLKVTV